MEVNGRIRRLVKFLTMALRDRPDGFGIRPDRQGYVPLMDLMGVILDERDFSWVTMKDVEAAVGSSRPPLFEISGTRIRVRTNAKGGKGGEGRGRSRSSRRRRRKRKPAGGKTGSLGGQGVEAAARSPGPGGEKAAGQGQAGGRRSSRRRRRKRRPSRSGDPKT